LVQSGDGYRLANVIPVPPADRIRQGLFRNTVFMPGSVLMRRSTFLAAGGFDPHFKFVEDWDLWFRLFHAGVSFAACLEPLLQQRMHASNQSNDGLAVLAECDEIYRRHALPHLRFPERLLRYNRVRSEHEMAAAFRLRSNRDPRCLSMTMRSILRDPFHDPLRYKVLLHILYTRLTANSNISPG
jgi:GT2 family glycosyltransferase